ncbi:MAG: glyoxalase/bleomycin resistance protein/dioxygenase [Gemmatimonadetes bacterium]|nr:glyoxalase/bleomycin resistance protein/dioxygenase [Gemmatimonadota bacterium]
MQSSDPRPTVYPCLAYDDAAAAIDWLVRVFGLRRHLVVPGEGGTILHAELGFGGGIVMAGTAKEDSAVGCRSPRMLGGACMALALYVEDVDAHYAASRAAGAGIVLDIADTPYGSRGYTARDPEGYTWTFGTYRPAFAPDDAAEPESAGAMTE